MEPCKEIIIENYKSKTFLKGIIYEWHCYNYVINEYKSVKIVKSKYGVNEENISNYFAYNSIENIIYVIGKTVLCEFDIVGIKNKQIFLWEISRGKTNSLHNKITRKINLMKILFPKYIITFCFIIPKFLDCYNRYDRIIVPEPDYEIFINNRQYIFSKNIKNCISLEYFSTFTNNNSLINEIIFASETFFSKGFISKQQHYKDLIKTLYDISQITNNEFNCYDIINKKYNRIKYNNNSYFINDLELKNNEIDIIKEIKNKIGNVT